MAVGRYTEEKRASSSAWFARPLALGRGSAPSSGLLLVLLVLALWGAGCKGRGRYEASWTLGGETLVCAGVPAPQLATARCGTLGIDAIKIEVIDRMGLTRDTSIFACGRCTPQTGPSLEAGVYNLRATPLGTDLRTLGDPATDNLAVEQSGIIITEGGRTPVAFDLIVPPQCSNGVDDDGDGLVDLMDPGCFSPDGGIPDPNLPSENPDGGVMDAAATDGSTDAPVGDLGADGALADLGVDTAVDAGSDLGSLDAARDAGLVDAGIDATLDMLLGDAIVSVDL